MKSLSVFLKRYRSGRDQTDAVFHRMGRPKFILTQGVAPYAITCVLLLTINYLRHGRYIVHGWWIAGFWAYGLIIGLALLCGGGTLAALYRWRQIERRIQQRNAPSQ
ncbi:MAG TPA: hypothetical protein VFW25_11050 [Silvibacterium sp.]|nr:hypothetical protein [Silvibacterium sp.]